MQHNKKNTNLFISVVFVSLLLITALIFHASTFFKYRDQSTKADTVVLFLGTEIYMEERKIEANRLLSNGYANYLIIPVLGKILKIFNEPLAVIKNELTKMNNSGSLGKYPKFYENTHVEVIEAKRIMDHFGFRRLISLAPRIMCTG